ncbi:MAG: hypothetical protein GY722_08965 [bacterium]|nr:hypothetical protein [bacterium]
MKFWRIVREHWSRFKRKARLKPERIQDRDLPPFDVPMTQQRILVRHAELSNHWNLLTSVTGIQFHYRFASFQEAASFVDREVGKIAAQIGYSPLVEIDDNDVVLTLGVETPQILTEGDFDFAEDVDGTMPQPEPLAEA